MKSIDEGVLDFRHTSLIRQDRSLENIGHEIKARVKEELGEWMTVNVGIGPNWFLAKLAAGLHKPDGLDIIDQTNAEGVYLYSALTDLNGINRRFRARLMTNGIMNPYEFLHTPEHVLTKQVFRSINGHHWYYRLRGYEVDDIQFGMRNVGKQYVLHHRTDDPKEINQILAKLCYYVSRRLQRYDKAAHGLALGIRYATPSNNQDFDDVYLPEEATRWFLRHKFETPFFSVRELHEKAMWLFNQSPAGQTVSQFTVTSYGLTPRANEQLSLYQTARQRDESVEQALQAVNDRYGELTLTPARMMGAAEYIPDKIAFGSVRYLLKDD